MTAQKMLNALPVLQRLMELKLPIKKAHGIYSLAKVINEQREFFMKEEQKLISKFNAEVLENGNIKFNSAEDQMTFSKEHADLMQYEIEELEKQISELKIKMQSSNIKSIFCDLNFTKISATACTHLFSRIKSNHII